MMGSDDALEHLGERAELSLVYRDNCKRFEPHDGLCLGFAGLWEFFKPEGSSAEDLEKSFCCMRTYTTEGSQDGKPLCLVWRNIHQVNPGLERVLLRDQDEFYECIFKRDLTEPYFSGIMKPTQGELSQGLPACMFWRSILLSPKGFNSCRLPLCLPPNPIEEMTDPGAAFANWNPHVMSSTTWAFEIFMQDGPWRWSAGPLYSMQTLRLVTHFCIAEREQLLNPDVPVKEEQWRPRTARPRLPEDPTQWLEGGAWKGSMHELIWDEDGEILALRPRPAAWHPPPANAIHRRLVLYEDGMYALWPLRISPTDEEAESTFQNGIRFEFGGMMKSSKEFRRIIVRYSVRGMAESVVVERYHEEDVAQQFDGRVRRSMDLRDKRRGSQAVDAVLDRLRGTALKDPRLDAIGEGSPPRHPGPRGH